MSGTKTLTNKTYSKSLITMIIAWITIVKTIQLLNDLLSTRDYFQNSSSVEYIAAATSVRVSKNLGLIPFDLKTRSQDFINQVRVELG